MWESGTIGSCAEITAFLPSMGTVIKYSFGMKEKLRGFKCLDPNALIPKVLVHKLFIILLKRFPVLQLMFNGGS